MFLTNEEIDQKIKLFIKNHPSVNLKHIQKLTNDTGILQHAKFNIPNYHHGYCLDDNCRALLLIARIHPIRDPEVNDKLIATYLAYIFYMQREDGNFINFMAYDLQFLEAKGSDDSFGRTIWALGELIANKEWSTYRPIALEIFNKGIRQIPNLISLRAKGYALLGILAVLTQFPARSDLVEWIKSLQESIHEEFMIASHGRWTWYESILSYDNAILPLALVKASQYLNDKPGVASAIKSFHFLDQLTFSGAYFQPVGNEYWYTEGGSFSLYGQQPIEIPMMMLLYQEMIGIGPDKSLLGKLQKTFLWFLGLNSKGLALFDEQSKGCCDGLEDYGVNQNQGAESSLSFWLAYQILRSVK